jgi:protein SCO1/2
MSGWLKGTRLWPLALALLATGAIAANTAPAPDSLPRDSVYQLPLPLTDQHGVTHDWRTRRGQPQVVAMFYGACPDMCPLTIDGGKAVEHALSPAERRRLQLLYISLDPQRDTPATLAALASKRGLDAQWSLATPRVQDVRSVAGVLGVRYRRLADGQFNHTSALLLLDRDGRIVARTERIGGAADPDFMASVHQLLR